MTKLSDPLRGEKHASLAAIDDAPADATSAEFAPGCGGCAIASSVSRDRALRQLLRRSRETPICG